MKRRLADWNLLLCVALLDLTLAGSCPTGWFGPECSLKCHCSDKSPCDLSTGECSSGVYCGKGFFGPGCQFADILAEMGSLSNPKFLVDGVKSTCNPDPKASSLNISLDHPSKIYWFRIHTDVDTSNGCLSLQQEKDSQLCQDLWMYRVSEKILDVTCNSSRLVTQLVIKGPIVGHICDLEISGGRNVALKQNATQSSLYHDNANGKAEAYHAVDGNRDPDFESFSCSHTNKWEDNPTWCLVLKKNEKIFRIVIYNRNVLQYRLEGFTMEIYSTVDGKAVFNETSTRKSSPIYFINMSPTMPSVKSIAIKKKHANDLEQNYLTLCEVELYKQHVCNPSFFGLYCNQSCRCEANRQCHPATGVCGTPTKTDKKDLQKGLQCPYMCYPNCLDNLCQDGECVSCKQGFEGAHCEEASCPVRKYGTNCTLKCPKNCLDSKCNKTTGHCLFCVGKQLLPLCDDDDPFPYLYQLLLLLLLIPLCLCFFCFFTKRRKGTLVTEETTPNQATMMQMGTSHDLGETKETGSSVDSDE